MDCSEPTRTRRFFVVAGLVPACPGHPRSRLLAPAPDRGANRERPCPRPRTAFLPPSLSRSPFSRPSPLTPIGGRIAAASPVISPCRMKRSHIPATARAEITHGPLSRSLKQCKRNAPMSLPPTLSVTADLTTRGAFGAWRSHKPLSHQRRARRQRQCQCRRQCRSRAGATAWAAWFACNSDRNAVRPLGGNPDRRNHDHEPNKPAGRHARTVRELQRCDPADRGPGRVSG